MTPDQHQQQEAIVPSEATEQKQYQALLDTIAGKLKESGSYSTEFDAGQLQNLMTEVVTDQVEQLITAKVPASAQNAIHTNLDGVYVTIADQKANVVTDFSAGIKVDLPVLGEKIWKKDIHGALTLANADDSTEHIQAESVAVTPAEIQIPGPIHAAISAIARTIRRDVEVPKSFNLNESLQGAIGGQKINGLFMTALNTQLQDESRAATISSIALQFTPQNTLKVDLQGGAFPSQAPKAA